MRLLPAALLALASLACGKPSLPQPGLPLAGKDYFPLAAGNRWVYASHLVLGGSPEDSKRAFLVKRDGDLFLVDQEGRGLLNAMTMLYLATGDGVTTKSGMFGAAKTQFDPPLVELPASIAAKATWTWTGTSSGRPMSMTSVLEGMESVTVPAGTFRCARIRRTTPQGIVIVHWYAEKVGLAKSEVRRPSGPGLPESSETLQLSSYELK